ncbi:T9SS type A sorting domain-containing protein [Sabulibacter ruber]|uniref:T9SS type A sorting domain-containing protein n=1 Tax=Sabulibacter ruber TaxID=2811901 RepID=UPI001A97122A|nr:T9SS type A sorting domain-containing protein [Sabulibacter ruber]
MQKPLLPIKAKPFLLLSLFFLIYLSGTNTQATHLRAGQILYKSDTTAARNPLKYFFTLVTYSVAPPPFEDLEATLFFGDCTSQTVARESRTLLSNSQNSTFVNIYRFEHTYSGPGTFTVAFAGENRNGGVVNISSSVQQTFFLQSTLTVDPLQGINRSPVLQYNPVDIAIRNQIFEHNPSAYDADGDSLSYKLVGPKVANGFDACGNPLGITAPGYRGLENYLGVNLPPDPAGLTLNRYTGQLTWNTPGVLGEFNMAFVVEEWRHGRLIGQVTRDMQIFVRESPNRPPVLLAPKDTCIVAGTLLRDTVRAIDPDGDRVVITAFGNMFPAATFSKHNDNAHIFNWQTSCQEVRREPYQVLLSAEDQSMPGTIKLVNLQPWRITVLGPPPVLVSATPQNGNSIQLTWESYGCTNARRIYIYRKVNPSGFAPKACDAGIPASAGYTLVGNVPATATSYVDNNNGQGLDLTQKYSYRMYADFNEPAGGKSVASNEVSVTQLTSAAEDIRQQISFYPNPASGVLMVQLPASGKLTTVQAFNAVGGLVASLRPQKLANGWALDVQNLADGFYLFALQTDQGTVIQRAVIKH